MNGPFYECSQTRELSEAKAKMIPYFNAFLEVKTMGHERFTSDHFYEQRVVSLHGESGGLKIRRERVGTVTTHLAPWSIG